MKKISDPDFSVDAVIERVNALRDRFGGCTHLTGKTLFPVRAVPPRTIYKYTSAEAACSVLGNCTLRYTQAEMLDAVYKEGPPLNHLREVMPEYEGGPTFVIDETDSEDRLMGFDRVMEARRRLRAEGALLADDTAIITSDGLNPDWKYELGNEKLKQVMEHLQKPLALSLTELENDERMWADYGNSSRGVVLGFSTRNKFFRSNRDRINQAGFFGRIEYRQASIEDYAYRYPFERFFLKSPAWAPQKEWRRLEFADNSREDWSSALKVFEFPPEILETVTFGARCSDADKEKIRQTILSGDRITHVRFRQSLAHIGGLAIMEL